MIIDGTFTSVWSNEGEVETRCKVNTETKEVFDIEQASGDIDYGILEYEYVTLSTDGKNYPVYSAYTDDEDWDEETCYWYA